MPALTARETARYGARLFGYMLTSTLVGGGLIVGGAVLAYVLEPAVLPGGRAPQDYVPVAAGVGLVLLGALVLLTGAVLIVFTVAADALRVGTRRRETVAAEGVDAAETQAVPSVDADSDDTSDSPADSAADDPAAGPASADDPVSDPAVAESAAEPDSADDKAPLEPEPTVAESAADSADDTVPPEPAESESESGPIQAETDDSVAESEPATDGEGRDPFASAAESGRHDEGIDDTDPIDEPHSASTNPFGEPAPEETTAEEWRSKAGEDDEAWREEIEAKLDGDEDNED